MLSELGPGVWEAVQPLRVAGFDFGHRMIVLRLSSGDLVVYSPVAFSSALKMDLEAHGKVRWIAAPSRMHDLYLRDWMEGFPQATLLHSPALRVKSVDADRLQPLARGMLEDLEMIPVEGMPKLQEFVFLHHSSRWLMVADLVSNLPPGRGMQKIFQKWSGLYERLAVSRFFKFYISHPGAFRASIQDIMAREFDHLSVGHGANVQRGAREQLAHSFEWLRLEKNGEN